MATLMRAEMWLGAVAIDLEIPDLLFAREMRDPELTVRTNR